jgi:hypothetical protein
MTIFIRQMVARISAFGLAIIVDPGPTAAQICDAIGFLRAVNDLFHFIKRRGFAIFQCSLPFCHEFLPLIRRARTNRRWWRNWSQAKKLVWCGLPFFMSICPELLSPVLALFVCTVKNLLYLIRN